MDESMLRQQLVQLATAAVPDAGQPPRELLRRAQRGRRLALFTALALATTTVLGGAYAIGTTRNLVGPSPMAGSGDQQIIDPPDRAFSGGYGLNVTIVDGRICASFEFQYFDGEEQLAAAQVCDPDPGVTMSATTRYVDTDNAMEPKGVVIVAAGVSPDVARVEVQLPDKSLPLQEFPIHSFKDHPRHIAADAFGRELFLDKQGRFDAVIRAFDSDGKLLAEEPLCDPREERC